MARGRLAWVALLACGIMNAFADEEAPPTDDDGDVEIQPQQNATPAERAKMMVTCKHAIWKKWSSSMEEVGDAVNATIASSFDEHNESKPQHNYSEATRILATAQLANCARAVTLADVEADEKGSLSETAVERLLGGSALGFNLTEQEYDTMDAAFKNQQVNSEAPALLGIQVHRVPWWLQILYMIGVVAALFWVIMKAVGALG